MLSVPWLCTFAVFLASFQAASSCEDPPLDICIVIDRTESVGASNYNTMLESVRTLISKYNVGPDKTHISIVTFAGDATVRASLDDSRFHNKEGLNNLIDEMEANDKLGNPTRTDIALEVVNNEVFTAKNGDRPESPNVMIVFTDGGKHENSKPYSEVLPPLKKKGVHRVAVGIGRKIEQAELEIIAGSPDRVVNAESFEKLDEQLDNIRETTCRIDGGYTEWSEWSTCSATCGGGVQWQSRNCTNPKPENNGKTCKEQGLGPAKQSQTCNTQPCGIDGGYTEWTAWTTCSATCGGGVQWQSRNCTKPKPEGDGKTCEVQGLGPAKQSQTCNTQPCGIDGGYTEWSEWSKCSATCGGGVQWQSRTCTKPKPEGDGKTCKEQGLGPAKQSRQCNNQPCGIDGGYTGWSEWSKCSATCGGGVKWQTRTCTKPKPEGDGKTCKEQGLGPAKQSQTCNTQACPCVEPPLDLCIVIDKTKSLGAKNFASMLESVRTLISKYDVGPDKTHIAIVSFAAKANVRASLDDPRFHNQEGLNNLIDKMKAKEKLGKPTRPDKALAVVNNEVFTAANGDRPDAPNVMIVFTDGGKHSKSKPFSEVLPPLEVCSTKLP
ncbi:hypothetical protein ACROYT_G022504 [Oculina patagonica]